MGGKWEVGEEHTTGQVFSPQEGRETSTSSRWRNDQESYKVMYFTGERSRTKMSWELPQVEKKSTD